jgi:hypothetical protein
MAVGCRWMFFSGAKAYFLNAIPKLIITQAAMWLNYSRLLFLNQPQSYFLHKDYLNVKLSSN